jgi:hypothetical protein
MIRRRPYRRSGTCQRISAKFATVDATVKVPKVLTLKMSQD